MSGSRLTPQGADAEEPPPVEWSWEAAEELAESSAERWDGLVRSGQVEMVGEPTGEPAVIVDADPRWPARFAEVASRLRGSMGSVAKRIDHVGSTAVAGLPAKPVIDVQVSVEDVEDEDAYRERIESVGFPLRSREPGHRYFRTPKDARQRIQVHVCSLGSLWERDHLLFRDYLRAHSAVADQYGRVKRELAARYSTDRIAYSDAKSPFIRAVVRRAETWAAETGWVP